MRELILAKREHLPLIEELERSTFSDPWSERSLELCLSENAFCICCIEDGRLLSYCTVITVLDEAQIINVATSSEFRGRGIAVLVLGSVFDECKKRRLATVSLEVRKSNAPAIALYKKLGFTVEGERRDFYKSPRENALVMIKKID